MTYELPTKVLNYSINHVLKYSTYLSMYIYIYMSIYSNNTPSHHLFTTPLTPCH